MKNTKRRKVPIVAIVTTLIVVLLIGFGAIFYYVYLEKNTLTQTQNKEMSANTKPLVKPRRQGITSQQLADSKDVPVSQKREDGTYTLVAVVEGQEANMKLSQAINTVTLQRKKLANLRQQFNVLPITAQQQRELIAGEINTTEAILKKNLSFMQANYSYNVQNQYLLIPEKATLTTLSSANGTVETVGAFDTFADYEAFQKANIEYQSRLNNLLTDWAKDQSANEKGQKVIENDQLIELKSGDSELVSLAQALSKDYNFDVTRKHNVQFDKSALYVKTTQN